MHRARRTAVLSILMALATPFLVATTTVPADAATEEQATYAKQAFAATNNVREVRDKVRLRHSDCLQKFANAQANLLADLDDLVHQDLGPILDKCKLNLAGENLALGYATGKAAVKDGWMHSPGHKANLLEKRYRLMAIAARQTEKGRWVAVQLFGRKK